MKKVRAIIILVITVSIVGAWFSQTKKSATKLIEYNANIKNADGWCEQGLYDRAIKAYRAAIEYNDKDENWKKLIGAYKLRADEALDSEDEKIYDYMNVLEEIIKQVEDNTEYSLELAQLYVEHGSNQKAYDILKYVISNGNSDKNIFKKYSQLAYIYELDNDALQLIIGPSNDMYAVFNGSDWLLVDTDGNDIQDAGYQYISLKGQDDIYIMTNEKDSRIYDSENNVLGIFEFKVEEAGIFQEGLVAIKQNNKYSYYDSFAKKQLGDYDMAGTFQNGTAAVCKDEKWGLINSKGKIVKDFKYEDIKLNQAGYYCSNSVILAKTDGKYRIYDEDFKCVNDKFECDDIDINAGDELIAFEKNGKWGFTNLEGKVVIEPQYEKAKSFSHGLAGVKIDGKWGFININNEVVIKQIFEDVDYFNSSDHCFVKTIDEQVEETASWQLLKFKVER